MDPEVDKITHLTFRATQELRDRVAYHSKEEDRTMAYIVTRALEKWLDEADEETR